MFDKCKIRSLQIILSIAILALLCINTFSLFTAIGKSIIFNIVLYFIMFLTIIALIIDKVLGDKEYFYIHISWFVFYIILLIF